MALGLIRGTRLRSLVLGLPVALIGFWWILRGVPLYYITYLEQVVWPHPEVAKVFRFEDFGSSVYGFSLLVTAAGIFVLTAGCLGILAPRWWSLSLLRKSCWVVYLTFFAYVYVLRAAVGHIVAAELDVLTGETPPPAPAVIKWTWSWIWPYGLLAVAVFFILHVQLWRRVTINHFTGRSETLPAWGDRFLERLRIHGDDPQYRKSVYGSIMTHLMVLIIIPFLLTYIGCVEDYRVPKGSGNPVVALVAVVKPKKKKKKKEYILNPQSAIYFKQPKLEDSKMLKEVEKVTELTYKAVSNAQAGKMGAGGGNEGGWPDGMEDAEVRFIRLNHGGPQWDDGMSMDTRADMNFLDEFHNLTGFKIRDHPEAHPMSWLRKYRKGFAPPFVYITGNGRINAGSADKKALREYLLGGGLLFADCGGKGFDGAFRSFISSVLPGKPLEVIPDDDPIFQMPFRFEEGAPPLWHHGGNRALGIKHNGRWCVFYHPGDLNDAWKTGASGLSKDKAEHAMQVGINLMYYSFTHYLELTRKYRK